ncbi:BRO-N domain-containing protein [Bacillus rhizoplanae]|uniref:BRO-N domain-containing protein n=1 Tax=Bacillus rhizoplanae TaxID=2880966 RepID=UPI003D1E0C50
MAKDVAERIEHSAVHMMIKVVDEDEKGIYNVYTLGGNQNMWFLTEDGLYEILMQSRKPIAKEFKKEVKRSNYLKVY